MHWNWTLPDQELQKFYDTPGIGDASRMINSLFSLGTILSAEKGTGFSYHVGHHSPCLRVCGTLHQRLQRTTESCWFVHDASYTKTFQRLSAKFQSATRWFRQHLLKSSNPFASIENLPGFMVGGQAPHMSDIEEGEITLVVEDHGNLPDVLRAVYVGPGAMPPERKLLHVGSNQVIDEINPLWELMAYPYFHPQGSINDAWSPHYKSVAGSRLRLLPYLRSVMLYEKNFWKSSRLAHQFILDGFARNEQQLAKVWASPTIQGRIRRYLSRVSASSSTHETDDDSHQQHLKIYLPAIVPGSFKYQQRFYHDALYMASQIGNPHLFITMTANPNWPEVKALLRPGENQSTRLDVINRVFDLKRRELLKIVGGRDVLFHGHRGFKGVVWVVEYQLCGLPHLHMAVTLNSSFSLEDPQTQLRLMDEIISARYPEDNFDLDLVRTFMVHNDPCKSCLRKNKWSGVMECRFHYPKTENDCARIDRRGYPLYRRGPGDLLVVPHNLLTLRRLVCHTNYEWTFNCACIAYLFKYFTKGNDSAGAKISDAVNEIVAFRKARVMTCTESVSRIFNFDANYRKPTVVLCKFALPPKQFVSEENNAISDHAQEDVMAERYLAGEPDDLLQDVMQPNAELDHGNEEIHQDFVAEEGQALDGYAYNGHLDYYLSRPSSLGDDLKFHEFYEIFYRIPAGYSKYTCVVGCEIDINGDFWKRRSDVKKALARVPWVTPHAGELYYLRKLIMHRPARSWAELLDGCATFRESAQKANLTDYDGEVVHVMQEANAMLMTPEEMRQLFVMLMLHSGHSPDVFGTAWNTAAVRNALTQDFFPSEARLEAWSDEQQIADMLSLAELQFFFQLNSSREVHFSDYGLPEPPSTINEVQYIVDHIGVHHPSLVRIIAHLGMVIDAPDVAQARPFSRVRCPDERNFDREIRRHLDVMPVLSDLELDELLGSLFEEQRVILDLFTARLSLPVRRRYEPSQSNLLNHLFFVDAPGGSGKTYLARVLAAAVRKYNKIALVCATTGVASLQFTEGRTAHNLFCVKPVEDKQVLQGPTIDSELLKILTGPTKTRSYSSRVRLLLECSVFIWDEFPMSNRMFIEAIDRLLRVVCDKPHVSFGGKVFVCLGDFRQVSPVVDEFVNRVKVTEESANTFETTAFVSSVKSSALWQEFLSVSLSINVRQASDPVYHSKIMKIGNGYPSSSTSLVKVRDLGVQVFYDVQESLSWLYDVNIDGRDAYHPVKASQRGFVTPYNLTVRSVNNKVSDFFMNHSQVAEHCEHLRSVDTVELEDPLLPPRLEPEDPVAESEHDMLNQMDIVEERLQADQANRNADMRMELSEGDAVAFDLSVLNEVALKKDEITEEFLNSLEFSGTPSHRLTVWPGAVVMVMRNLDYHNGIMNGTRLVVESVSRSRKIIVLKKPEDFGNPEGQRFYIPRLKFVCKIRGYDARITRKQFPLRLCYAYTIHKAQSATLERAVVDLRAMAFDHGMIYVALSRVRSVADIRLLLNYGQEEIVNIVYQMLVQG